MAIAAAPRRSCHGGTGITFYKGCHLRRGERSHRAQYRLSDGAVVPAGQRETILSGLPLTGDHPMHPFVIDPQGNLYVDLGSATNPCQAEPDPEFVGH
jgi:glucose/arabinose dehydrogenase